jgi:hypothetical protein
MTLQVFLQKLESQPEAIEFSDTIATIEASYQFTETAFENGAQRNEAGQNSGSCKIFAFAKLNGLSEAQALACFGQYYRDDVLGHPEGSDHQNIRQFMAHGWAGINFSGTALIVK